MDHNMKGKKWNLEASLAPPTRGKSLRSRAPGTNNGPVNNISSRKAQSYCKLQKSMWCLTPKVSLATEEKESEHCLLCCKRVFNQPSLWEHVHYLRLSLRTRKNNFTPGSQCYLPTVTKRQLRSHLWKECRLDTDFLRSLSFTVRTQAWLMWLLGVAGSESSGLKSTGLLEPLPCFQLAGQFREVWLLSASTNVKTCLNLDGFHSLGWTDRWGSALVGSGHITNRRPQR